MSRSVDDVKDRKPKSTNGNGTEIKFSPNIARTGCGMIVVRCGVHSEWWWCEFAGYHTVKKNCALVKSDILIVPAYFYNGTIIKMCSSLPN